MRNRNVIPIHLRVTTLDEFTEVISRRYTRNRVSFEEMRNRIRERTESTEGVRADGE